MAMEEDASLWRDVCSGRLSQAVWASSEIVHQEGYFCWGGNTFCTYIYTYVCVHVYTQMHVQYVGFCRFHVCWLSVNAEGHNSLFCIFIPRWYSRIRRQGSDSLGCRGNLPSKEIVDTVTLIAEGE